MIGKIVGKMWHDEPESVKNEWMSKSENVKCQHLEDHPDYPPYLAQQTFETKRRITSSCSALTRYQAFDPSHHSYNGSNFSFLSDDHSAARP